MCWRAASWIHSAGLASTSGSQTAGRTQLLPSTGQVTATWGAVVGGDHGTERFLGTHSAVKCF